MLYHWQIKTQQLPSGSKKMDESTVQCVQKFYFQDLISQQASGRRDYVIGREGRKKSKLLKATLNVTFGFFQKENPDIKISLSKFSSLRPVNVLLQLSMPREVCLCMYHDNAKSLCDCLSKEPGGGGVLPIMAYTGRLCPKGLPFSRFRYMKG